jgi:thioredoxin-related protein
VKRFIIPYILIASVLAVLSCGGETESSGEKSPGTVEDLTQQEQMSTDRARIEWYDYDEGMRELIGTARYGVLYFDTLDCAPCVWMDSLFKIPEIVDAVNKDFIAIKIQTARNDTIHYQGMPFTESHLRKLFFLAGYPTTLFIEGRRNKIIGGQPGRIPPRKFLDYLAYMTSKAYDVVTFEEYIDNRERERLREQ